VIGQSYTEIRRHCGLLLFTEDEWNLDAFRSVILPVVGVVVKTNVAR
jgi:hypothetical protein